MCIGATVSWRNDTYLVQSRVGCLPAKVASYAGTSTSKQEASALPGRCEPMDSVWLGGVGVVEHYASQVGAMYQVLLDRTSISWHGACNPPWLRRHEAKKESDIKSK